MTEVESDFPEAWKPNAGDTITGKFAGLEVIDPGGNGPYPVLTLDTADGARNVHAFHQVLRTEVAKRRPKIGDELTITYQGKRPGGKNGEYHSYRVSGGSPTEVNWDDFLPTSQASAPPSPAPLSAEQVAALRAQRDAAAQEARAAKLEDDFGSVPF